MANFCSNCGTSLNQGVKFCSSCGTEVNASSQKIEEDDFILDVEELNSSSDVLDGTSRPTGKADGLLVTLGVLSILGCVFGMARGMFYEAIGSAEYTRGMFYVLGNFVALVGVIFMLNTKLAGLYVYSAGQIIYLATVLYAATMNGKVLPGAAPISFTISAFFFLPSAVFLVLYWMPMVKRQLR